MKRLKYRWYLKIDIKVLQGVGHIIIQLERVVSLVNYKFWSPSHYDTHNVEMVRLCKLED